MKVAVSLDIVYVTWLGAKSHFEKQTFYMLSRKGQTGHMTSRQSCEQTILLNTRIQAAECHNKNHNFCIKSVNMKPPAFFGNKCSVNM